MPGCFITFEGLEGCGKSTHIKLLDERLRAEGANVLTLREPGGTKSGEEMRRLLKHGPEALAPMAELLLMNASRAQLVDRVIQPALIEGKIVLCDRFYDSTTAYQGHGRGLDLQNVQSAIRLAVGGLDPDLTLLLQVSLDTSEQRRVNRTGSDRFENSERSFFERVKRGYIELAAAHPGRIQQIDAQRSLKMVQADIWTHASRLLENSNNR